MEELNGGPWLELLGLLLPIIVAFLTRYVYQGVEELLVVLDKLPALGKQLAVVVVAFALTYFSKWLGVEIPLDLGGWTPEIVSAILSALGAFGLHKLKKPTAPPA